jgi:alkylation response protein AidB-like acyl-CoA dehydrogenase
LEVSASATSPDHNSRPVGGSQVEMSQRTIDAPQSEHDVIARVRDMVPDLRARVPEAERAGRVLDETIADIVDSGLLRLAAPPQLGGFKSSFRAQQDVLTELARGCGGTSWVAGIYVMMANLYPTLSDQALQDVYAAGPNPMGGGVFSADSLAKAVPGGYQLSGRWPWCGGHHHANWMLLPAPVNRETGVEMLFFLVPRSGFVALDDWSVSGMSATGSATLVIEDEFVPEHRVIPMLNSLHGHPINTRYGCDSYYQMPAVVVFSAVGAGTVLGMARAALDIFLERIHTRGITYSSYTKQAGAPIAWHQMAEATMKYDRAVFHAHRAVDAMDEIARNAGKWDTLTRIRVRADAAQCWRLSEEVIDIVQSAGGASQIHLTDPLQRIVRDANAMVLHSQYLSTTCSELYGRVLCGLEPDVPYF